MTTLRVGRTVARWRVWSTTASVVVTEPDALAWRLSTGFTEHDRRTLVEVPS